jgi:hypothetical protein
MRQLETEEAISLVAATRDKLADAERATGRAREWAEEAGMDERLPTAFDELTALASVLKRTLDQPEEAGRRLRQGEESAPGEVAHLWRAAHALEERVAESVLVARFRQLS